MEEGPISEESANKENAPAKKFEIKKVFRAAISRLPKPKTKAVTSSLPQGKGRARKVQPSEWLLPVPDHEFNEAEKQLNDKPDGSKLKKGKSKFSCSYIKIGGVVYALANGVYLGEGAYGKVKIVQDRTGRCFAVKIEGKGTYAEQNAETNIAKALGYFRGKAERKLDEATEFKGHDIDTKVYTVVELRKGKEIFQHLYSTALKPGQLYKDTELKRKKSAPLTSAQRLLIAYKSCERTNDLHRRGIIHGDLKPANFMAAVNGNHIVVGSIDFGFSFRLDKASGERVIVHPGAPNGTPLKYMPPEVRRAHALSENRQDAEFSFASDIYSLGIMFRDDMQLPKEVYEQMCADNANQRCSVTDAMKKIVAELEKIPENERDPEITKIIEESRRGVRQKEKADPQAKDTLVAQLMSGMRDPRETEGESRSINYTLDDFKEYAHMIFAKLTPEEFYTQLCDAYQRLDNIEDKQIFIHNAECFIKELIAMDVNQDFKGVNNTGIAQFLRIRDTDNEAKPFFDEFEQAVKIAYAKTDSHKAKLEQEVRSFENITDGEIDIQDYLKNQLAQSRAAGIGSRINKILGGKVVAIDTHEFKKHAKAFAHDLREQQIALIKQLNISDYYNKKSLDRGWDTKTYQKIVDFNNKIVAMAQQDILSATSKAHQKRLFEFYFNVVEQSIELGDFATAASLFSMLEAGNVGRLEYLKDQNHLAKRYAKCRNLMSTEKNNKNLKEEMENRLVAGSVMIPPQSIVAGQSLLSIEDTIPSYVNNKTNEFKLARLANQLMVAAEAQSNLQSYDMQPCRTNLVSKFKQPLLDEGNLYKLSMTIQGRKVNDQSPAPQFDQVGQNVANLLEANAKERDQETLRANKLIADIQQAKVAIDAFVVETAELAELLNIKKLCDVISGATLDKNNSVKLAIKVNQIDKNKVVKINQAIATKQAAQQPVPPVAEIPNAAVGNAADAPIVAAEAPVAEVVAEPVAAAEVPVAEVVAEPVVAAEVPVAEVVVAPVGAVEVPAAQVVDAPVGVEVQALQEPAGHEDAAPVAQVVEDAAAKQAQAQARELAFLQGGEYRLPAQRNLENLLKQYVIAVFETQSKDPAAVQKALPIVEGLNEQVKQLIERIEKATQSGNEQVKATAMAVKVSTSDMVKKYQDLNAHLDAKSEEPSIGKKVKGKVKKVVKKVKRIARPDDKAKAKPKDTLSYINALRDETQKRTRALGAMAPDEQKEEMEVKKVKGRNERRVHFADEENGRPLAQYDDESESVAVPVSLEEEIPLEQGPSVTAPVVAATQDPLLELQRMQRLLEEPNSVNRNQIEIDAMKMGVRILMTLPKEKKPSTFADILKQASIVSPMEDRNLQALKEAALTIIAVLIPPKATLMELNTRAEKMSEKIKTLEQIRPMTPQIQRKIKLRKDIVQHIRSKFTEEAEKAQKATVRPSPVQPTRPQSVTVSKEASSRNSQQMNKSSELNGCIAEFEQMVENINDPQYKKLFKEDVDPKRTMLLILYELREMDPKSVTPEQIDALYSKGKKYWNEDDQGPQKDNPLIKLKGQLAPAQNQKGVKPNPV